MLRLAFVILIATAQCADARRRIRPPEEKACWAEVREKVPSRMECTKDDQGESCANLARPEQRALARECLKRVR
jgi:hypothetical protein